MAGTGAPARPGAAGTAPSGQVSEEVGSIERGLGAGTGPAPGGADGGSPGPAVFTPGALPMTGVGPGDAASSAGRSTGPGVSMGDGTATGKGVAEPSGRGTGGRSAGPDESAGTSARTDADSGPRSPPESARDGALSGSAPVGESGAAGLWSASATVIPRGWGRLSGRSSRTDISGASTWREGPGSPGRLSDLLETGAETGDIGAGCAEAGWAPFSSATSFGMAGETASVGLPARCTRAVSGSSWGSLRGASCASTSTGIPVIGATGKASSAGGTAALCPETRSSDSRGRAVTETCGGAASGSGNTGMAG